MQDKRNAILRAALMSIVFACFLLLYGCATTGQQLGTIPLPTETNKLRVFVCPVSDNTMWRITHEEYVKNHYRTTARFLSRKDIYEVVPFKDVASVLGKEWSRDPHLQRSDWALARQAAKALHADYIMAIERGHLGNKTPYLEIAMINTENGKKFKKLEMTPGRIPDDLLTTIKAAYRSVFIEAQNDMLATAIKKGRLTRNRKGSLAEESPSTAITSKPAEAVDKQKQPLDQLSDDKAKELIKDPSTFYTEDTSATGKTKLVVYDFASSQNLNVIALILSEALREELYRMGKYTLVNRDNLSQFMDEFKLQQSGLVDEKEAVKIGKWLAAQESVTGRIDVLGGSYVLFAKRTDITSLGTLSIVSVKCPVGEEENLLKEMTLLAAKLVKLQAQ